MAKPQDVVIATDMYGSSLRLNPNEASRSYATRTFRVRLDPDWAYTDASSGDGLPWHDGSSALQVGKLRRAIFAAVTTTPGDHPDLSGLIVQDINARQVGPHDFEVQANYYRTETGGLRGTAKSVNVSTRPSSTPVYRTPYNDAGVASFANGLPNGNFAGLGDDQYLPRGANYQSWQYEYPLTEALVQISAELNVATYAPLFTGSGALAYVNYYNSNDYTNADITFAQGTLKFLGLSTQSRIIGGNRSYTVAYTYLWRPGGWFRQELSTGSPAPSGFFKTTNVDGSYPRVAFNSSLFPDS